MSNPGRFDQVTDAIVRELGGAMFGLGELVAVEAQISITTSATSAKGQHVVSAPGEAPNNLSGDLAGGIEVNQVAPLTVEVSSNAAHAVPLEIGTSKMAARPYFGPARNAKRAEVQKKAAQAVNRALRKFARR